MHHFWWVVQLMQNENWRHIFQGQTWDKIRGKNVEQTIINKMRSYGEESRAMLYFEWNDGGAHVINVERRKSGEVLYVDSQDGKLVPAAMLFVSAKSFELSNVKDKKPTKLIEYCVKKRS